MAWNSHAGSQMVEAGAALFVEQMYLGLGGLLVWDRPM
jgi:hypothetical protein